MARKRKKFSYDINDPFDKDMAIDVPFSLLNKRGRRAKKRRR